MMAPALTQTLGRERRCWNVSKRVFSPCALGTIEEDALYEENNSPRQSFGHLPSVCSSPDGAEESLSTRSDLSAAEERNAELEARLLELEKKLAELSAAQP